jgi:hypothetical protein
LLYNAKANSLLVPILWIGAVLVFVIEMRLGGEIGS